MDEDSIYIDNANDLLAAVQQLQAQPQQKLRTIDTETTGSRPYVERLKVVQIGVAGLPVFVIQIERIPTEAWTPLREYLAEDRPNVMQNGKFDLKMLVAENLPLRGPVRDTMLRSRLLHLGNRNDRHSLKELALRWCNLPLDKTEQKSFLHDDSRRPLSRGQRVYAANDITTTTAVEAALSPQLADRPGRRPGVQRQVDREERFLPVLAQLENRGVRVNQDAVAALDAAIRARLEAIEAALRPALQPNLQQLKLPPRRPAPFKPRNLPEDQIKDLLQIENCDTKSLLRICHQRPQAKLVLEHATLWRQLDACQELLQKQNPKTGRAHPDYNQVENVQGTLGASKLKLELLARLAQCWRPETPRLLQPADGYALLQVSFPSLDACLLAHYSQDPQLLADLERGQSPTARIATAIRKSGENPYADAVLANALWQGAGVLHQKGTHLQSWLFSEFGLILSLQQVKALQPLIPNRYPTLAAFQDKIMDRHYEERATILGSLKLWHQSSAKDLRKFLVWTSIDEILKACVCELEPWCGQSGSRTVFIDEQSLWLEVPAAKAADHSDAVLEVLVAALGRLCPQIAIELHILNAP